MANNWTFLILHYQVLPIFQNQFGRLLCVFYVWLFVGWKLPLIWVMAKRRAETSTFERCPTSSPCWAKSLPRLLPRWRCWLRIYIADFLSIGLYVPSVHKVADNIQKGMTTYFLRAWAFASPYLPRKSKKKCWWIFYRTHSTRRRMMRLPLK